MMAQGAASYGGAYVSNKVAGLETHFNWTDLAIATVSSGITGKTGNHITDAVNGMNSPFLNNFAGNLWGSAVSSSLSRVAGRGGKQDWGSIGADAFGNASAIWLVQQFNKPKGTAPIVDQRDTAAKKDAPISTTAATPEAGAISHADGQLTPVEQSELRVEQAKGGSGGASSAPGGIELNLSNLDFSNYDFDGLNASMAEMDAMISTMQSRFDLADTIAEAANYAIYRGYELLQEYSRSDVPFSPSQQVLVDSYTDYAASRVTPPSLWDRVGSLFDSGDRWMADRSWVSLMSYSDQTLSPGNAFAFAHNMMATAVNLVPQGLSAIGELLSQVSISIVSPLPMSG